MGVVEEGEGEGLVGGSGGGGVSGSVGRHGGGDEEVVLVAGDPVGLDEVAVVVLLADNVIAGVEGLDVDIQQTDGIVREGVDGESLVVGRDGQVFRLAGVDAAEAGGGIESRGAAGVVEAEAGDVGGDSVLKGQLEGAHATVEDGIHFGRRGEGERVAEDEGVGHFVAREGHTVGRGYGGVAEAIVGQENDGVRAGIEGKVQRAEGSVIGSLVEDLYLRGARKDGALDAGAVVGDGDLADGGVHRIHSFTRVVIDAAGDFNSERDSIRRRWVIVGKLGRTGGEGEC